MTELQLLELLKEHIQTLFPYVKDVKMYSTFLSDTLQESQITCYVNIYENIFSNLHTSKEARCNVFFVIKDEKGYNSLSHIGNDLLEQFHDIKNQNKGLLGILVPSMSEPRFDKEKFCWYRMLNIRIRYK